MTHFYTHTKYICLLCVCVGRSFLGVARGACATGAITDKIKSYLCHYHEGASKKTTFREM